MATALRNLRLLDVYRRADKAVMDMWGWAGDDKHGCFELPSPIDNAILRVIVSGSEGWDHVSVSRTNRCPNWAEMEHIKRLFWRDDATVMQLHLPPAEHLSLHPNCLHMWKPHDGEIPKPPPIMVAPPKVTA